MPGSGSYCECSSELCSADQSVQPETDSPTVDPSASGSEGSLRIQARTIIKTLKYMIAYLGNAFVVLLEGQASPRDKVSLHSLQVDNVLLARGTGYSAKWFLSKHSIILVVLALLAEDHLEQSVDLTLQLRQPLVGLLLVGEPVQQAADEVAHASLKCIQIRLVGLGVQHLKDVGELVFSVPP